jgi:hypothetical protein
MVWVIIASYYTTLIFKYYFEVVFAILFIANFEKIGDLIDLRSNE